jgi:hypothetical protein
MQKRKMISYAGKILNFVLMLAVGWFSGIIIGKNMTSISSSLPFERLIIELIFLAVFGIIGFILHIIIHEAGHMVFGLLTGYSFVSFRIFSFMWVNDNGHIRFTRYKVNFAPGQCIMLPPSLDENNQIPYLLYNFGGVIFNILASIISLLILLVVGLNSLFGLICFIFLIMGILLAFSNGWPMITNSINNDGMNAFDIMHYPEAARAFWITLHISNRQQQGERLKEMPSSWFTLPSEESMKNGLVSSIAVYKCNRFVDERRFEEAAQLIDHLLSIDTGIVSIHRSILIAERTYIELITSNREELIENQFINEVFKIMKYLKNEPSIIRVLYAYNVLRRKNKNKAEQLKKKFEKVVSSYPYPQEAAAERELMQLVDEIASQKS